MRKEKKVQINGDEYLVQEPTVGAVINILPRLGGEDAQEAQFDLIGASVTLKGKPIVVKELGLSTYMQLMKEVLEVNGLGKMNESP